MGGSATSTHLPSRPAAIGLLVAQGLELQFEVAAVYVGFL